MKTGRILKGIGGFYTVRTSEGELFECHARGRFRKDEITPLPGDIAEFEEGFMLEILPRKNRLTRPAVANADALLIVLSVEKPQADLLLTDRLLIYAAYNGLDCAIAFNKADAAQPERLMGEYSKAGIRLIALSAKEKEGLDELKKFIEGRFVCLAGQSAVGKSSLLNAIAPDLSLPTGGLSKKTDRGKHTTRHSELIELSALNAFVADTPGFSMLACEQLEPEQLSGFYPEFKDCECRFPGCLHLKEPGCAVRDAAKNGTLPAGRYERYLALLKELTERKEKRYD